MEGTPQPGGDKPAPAGNGNGNTGDVKVASVDTRTLGLAMLSVVLGFGLGWLLNDKVLEPPTLTLKSGISQFAAFYAFAQALERLLEPFAMWRDSKSDSKPHKTKKALKAATVRRLAAETGLLAASQTESDPALKETRFYELESALTDEENRSAEAEAVRGARTVAYWAWATVIATLISGAIGLYFLQSILDGVPKDGDQVKDWFRVLDISFTGLVIGSGTKPLHDLISKLEKKSDTPTTGTGGK